MRTYQDLLLAENNKEGFILSAINDYKSSDMYYWAVEGEAYSRQKNTAITKYRKMIRNLAGKLQPDLISANHKTASNFLKRFITQENQFLLGNGVQFIEDHTDKLGKDFDSKIQRAGYEALKAGVSYVFYNLDHIEVFPALQFAPLFDEEDGALKAGIRFWQIDTSKPLRATLFELDGYTEYIFNSRDKSKKGSFEILKPKTSYKIRLYESSITTIYEGMNYPTFPIVPLWSNNDHQSELVGLKEEIDAYDLLSSGLANDLDDVSQIYWILENSGGMDDVSLAEFLQKLRNLHIAEMNGDQGQKITPYTVEVPHEARDAYLDRLEHQLYNDAMALNTAEITNGNVTATAIQASYEPLNNKTDEYEYCVRDCINNILLIAEIEDEPTFKRSMMANQLEVTQMVLSAAEYLDEETILKKLPFIDDTEIEDILSKMEKEETDRFEEETTQESELLLPEDVISATGNTEESGISGSESTESLIP